MNSMYEQEAKNYAEYEEIKDYASQLSIELSRWDVWTGNESNY